MKKSILKIGLLSFILIIISMIVMLIFGRIYTMSFANGNGNNCQFIIDNNNIEVLE